LDKESLGELFNYECKSDFQTLCLDVFKFSYLCNGANISDLLRLQYKNIIDNDTIVFERKKTGTLVEADFNERMREILQRSGNVIQNKETYLFPVLEPRMKEDRKHFRIKHFTKNVNVHLKEIAGEVGIDQNISSIWARHSHASALKRSGKVSMSYIQEALGHTNIEITERYLSRFDKKERKKASEILTDFD